MCLLTNERYKTYQTVLSFDRLGHTPGVGHGVPCGVGVKFVFFRNSTRFGVWVTYMNGICNGTIFGSPPPGSLGRSQKVKYHLIWITKSILKTFKPNFVYLLTNERYIIYQAGFSFGRLGHAQGCDFWVPLSLGDKKNPKFNHIWCVNYLNELHMNQHHFLGPQTPRPWGGVKNLIFWTWSCGISN